MNSSDTTAYERILDALREHGRRVIDKGTKADAQCPAHDDSNPSVTVTRSDGRALVWCHAGCDTRDVVAALGLSMADLYDERRATYRYTDGRIVSRYYVNGKKAFSQTCAGDTSTLYHPDRLQAAGDGEVFLVEGEADVHAIEAAGGVATTAPQGADSFHKVDVSPLAGRQVTVVVDRDAGGDKWATQVRAKLAGVVARYRFVHAEVGCKDASDHVAAGHGLTRWVPYQPPQEPPDPQQDQPPANPLDAEAVNWPALMARDLTQADWLGGKLLERGQQMALLGEGKVGKSLFCFEWALHLATGRAFLGDEARDPVKVLYIDAENTHVDLQRRMAAQRLQIDLTRLGNLVYLSFPPIGPLDTRDGAVAFADRVRYHRPDIVFIDTISRYIEGNENDASTWQAVYRLNGVGLKRAGIASVRLDHFGKDTTRGGRGSSAKTQDIDHVWELTGTDPMFRLKRTHTRSGISDGDLAIRRHGAPGVVGTTYHELMPKRGEAAARVEWLGDAAIDATIAKLAEAEVPNDFGRDRLRDAGLKLGIQHGTDVWSEIARRRKERLR